MFRHLTSRDIFTVDDPRAKAEAYFQNLVELDLIDHHVGRYHLPTWFDDLLSNSGRQQSFQEVRAKTTPRVGVSCALDNPMGLAVVRRMAQAGPTSDRPRSFSSHTARARASRVRT
jgi:hypothetical protein